MAALSTARRDEIIEGLAQRMHRWGLQTPAIFFLEAHKPFGFLGSQLLLFAQPLVGFFLADSLVRDVALLLEGPGSLEQLIGRLEELARTSDSDPGDD